MKKRRVIRAVEIIEVAAILKQQFDMEAMKYRDDYSDEKVAGLFNGMSPASVAGLRKQLGMQLRVATTSEAQLKLTAELELRVVELEQNAVNQGLMIHRLSHIVHELGRHVASGRFNLIVLDAQNKFPIPKKETSNGKA